MIPIRNFLGQPVFDGETGLLADTVDQFSRQIIRLLRDPALARRLGEGGHQHVQERFLLPRFIIDELRLLGKLAGATR